MEKRKYVVGFMFNSGTVLLIRKTKPEWQAGRLNGVGGKVEEGESFLAAMVREFREETGMETLANSWRESIIIQGKDYILYVYATIGDLSKPYSNTEENLELYPAKDLPPSVLYNLRWMIPLLGDDHVTFPIHVNDYVDKQNSVGVRDVLGLIEVPSFV